jgi:hypothetical protein
MSVRPPTLPTPDRNLLVGLLALQLGFVVRADLRRCLASEFPDKRLAEAGRLTPERFALLDALIGEHLADNLEDPRRSLEALRAAHPGG